MDIRNRITWLFQTVPENNTFYYKDTQKQLFLYYILYTAFFQINTPQTMFNRYDVLIFLETV